MNRLICSGFFFIYCSIFGTIAFSGHVIEITQNVTQIISQYKMKMQQRLKSLISLSKTTTIDYQLQPQDDLRIRLMMPIMLKHHNYYDLPLRYQRIFHFQLHEHNRTIFLVISGCRLLFGWVLFAFLLIHIPINVNLIRRCIYIQHLTLVELLVIWVIGLAQILITCFVICPLAWAYTVYHSPKKFIPTFQLLSTTTATIVGGNGQNGWLWYKLKYDDLYQRLLYGPKFALSIGPVKEVTYFNSLEVIY